MDFDVIVIGTGQADVPLASRLARDGRSVLLAERRDLGGTCVNTPCLGTERSYAQKFSGESARAGS